MRTTYLHTKLVCTMYTKKPMWYRLSNAQNVDTNSIGIFYYFSKSLQSDDRYFFLHETPKCWRKIEIHRTAKKNLPLKRKKMRSEFEIYQTRITLQFKLKMKVMFKVNTFITPLPITSAVFFRFHITINFYYIILPKSRKFGWK